MKMRGINILVFSLLLLYLGCEESKAKLQIKSINRGGDVEFACIGYSGSQYQIKGIGLCNIEIDKLLAFVLDMLRGEVIVVDLSEGRYYDMDQLLPAYQGFRVGLYPEKIVSFYKEGVLLIKTTKGEIWYYNVLDIFKKVKEAKRFDIQFEVKDLSYDYIEDKAYLLTTGDPKIIVIKIDGTSPQIVNEISLDSLARYNSDIDGGLGDILTFDLEDSYGDESISSDLLDIQGESNNPTDYEPEKLEVIPGKDLIVISSKISRGIFILKISTLELQYINTTEPIREIKGWPDGRWLYYLGDVSGDLYVVDLEESKELNLNADSPWVDKNSIDIPGVGKDLIVIDYEDPEFKDRDSTESEYDPKDLLGIYGIVVSSNGRFYVVDGEERFLDYCWIDRSRNIYNEEVCKRHILRANTKIDSLYPHISKAPKVYFREKNYNLEKYPPVPDENGIISSLYPWFYFDEKTQSRKTPILSGGENEEEYYTYGVFFDWKHYWWSRKEKWKIEYEGIIPGSEAKGGNIEESSDNKVVLNDRGKSFCKLGVLGKMENYDGDILVIVSPPSPLNDSIDCSQYMVDYIVKEEKGEVKESVRLEYRIDEVWDHSLLISRLPNGPPLPKEDCFPFAVRYYIRPQGQWIIKGGFTGFLHNVIADKDGRCILNEKELNCGEAKCSILDGGEVSHTPYNFVGPPQCLKNSRATFGKDFVNPIFCFRLMTAKECESFEENSKRCKLWGDEVMPFSFDYIEFEVEGGYEPLSYYIGELPIKVKYNPFNNKLYFIDQASNGLVEFDLEIFKVVTTYY